VDIPKDLLSPDAELFLRLHERWNATVCDAKKWADLDEELVPTLISLSKVTDIIPIWSCASHPAKNIYSGHVVLGLGSEGLANVIGIWQELNTRTIERIGKTEYPLGFAGFTLQFSKLTDPTIKQEQWIQRWYTATSIEFNTRWLDMVDMSREEFFSMFNDTVKQFIR
jgi:hypothetical protein